MGPGGRKHFALSRAAAAVAAAACLLTACYVSVNDGKVGIGNFPVILSEPHSTAVRVGESAVFNVTAGGFGPLEYQWQRNGIDISGATGNTYVTPPAQLADDGAQFRVIVSNPVGSIASRSAALSVIP